MPAARTCAALVALVKRPRLPSRTRTRASRSTDEERSSPAHSPAAARGGCHPWPAFSGGRIVLQLASPASCRPGAPSWRLVAAIRAARHSHAEVAAWLPGRFGREYPAREYPLRCPGSQAANHRLVSPGIVPTSGRSKRPIGRLAPPPRVPRRGSAAGRSCARCARTRDSTPRRPGPPLSPGNGSNTAVRATAAGGAPGPRARRGQPAPPTLRVCARPANPTSSAYTYIAAHHQTSRQPGEFQGRRRPRVAQKPRKN